ncbi:hypothetical protein BJ508DRAFT_325692 [Ascobolus immersus RN42]|uniref:Uncharacterized protein n=1 Tax=Ascobolus immersus RN42 TaxID=1160509 RepID=A0A3N4I9L1_ASCIM|nr:hypothetical protein BJ508DRAFT_325692 [Ascobolus immersus RN42]
MIHPNSVQTNASAFARVIYDEIRQEIENTQRTAATADAKMRATRAMLEELKSTLQDTKEQVRIIEMYSASGDEKVEAWKRKGESLSELVDLFEGITREMVAEIEELEVWR